MVQNGTAKGKLTIQPGCFLFLNNPQKIIKVYLGFLESRHPTPEAIDSILDFCLAAEALHQIETPLQAVKCLGTGLGSTGKLSNFTPIRSLSVIKRT